MALKLPRRKVALAECWSERKVLKRLQNRQERQRAKRDPEGAPTRRIYSGWAD